MYTVEQYAAELEHLLVPKLTAKEDKRKKEAGEWWYSGLSFEEFKQQMMVLLGLETLPQHRVFVDVGCGIGAKLLLARRFLERASTLRLVGIETSPQYVRVARQLLKRKYCKGMSKIIHKDARLVDFSKFDIIYFFCPMSFGEIQSGLEDHMVKTAKVGAIFLANNKQNQPLWKSDVVKHLWGGIIYQKVK